MRIDVVGEGAEGLAEEASASQAEVCARRTAAEVLGEGVSLPELILVAWSAANEGTVRALARSESPVRGRIVAAVTDPAFAAEALAAGADDVLFRPIRRGDLEARAESLVWRASAATALQQVVATLQCNEDHLRAFMDHLPGPAFVRDVEGRHPYVNVAFQEISGRTREFLRDNGCFAWMPQIEAERIHKRTEEIIATGRPLDVKVLIPVPGSGVRHFFVCEFLMKDSGGRQLIGGISMDQTEREVALRSLRRSEASFRALIEHCPDAVVVHRKGDVLFANQAVMTLMGVRESHELTRREMLEFVHPDDRPQAAARMRERERVSGPLPFERIRLLRADGAARACEGVSVPIVFDGQRSFLVFFRDITERERLQEKLLVTERLASVGTLAAGVAHEINNPLAWLISGLEWLEEDFERWRGRLDAEDAQEIAATLKEVQQGAERVRHIVKELKTFSRGDDEGSKGVDLARVLETAVKMAGNELKHRARVVKQLDHVPLVRGNSVRLGQVFLNLIVNAAQSIPEGRADENEVRIRLYADRGRALVEISDTGSGMSPEIQRRVFDPFFTTKAVGEGTGLGLSIVHGIVSRLGGEIAVESSVGRGTTFRVWLPATEGDEERERGGFKLDASSHRRGRVLVIDDEPMIGASVRRTLSNEHEVVVVTRGAEAIARLAAGERFEVLLSDLMMPEMTGMELYEELSRRWPDAAERMVFLTGGAFTARARQFLEHSRNRRMEKPFDAAALRALVREMVCEACPGESRECNGHKSMSRGLGKGRSEGGHALPAGANE